MSKNIYAEVTAKIVAQLEQGVMPWVRPWSQSSSSRDARAKDRWQPHNLISNRPYHGINSILLMMIGSAYPTGAWATYKQIAEAGGQVRRGEKATQVVYFDRIEVKDRNSDDPNATKKIPLLRYFSVFNHAQADWPADKDPLRKQRVAAEKDDAEAPHLPQCDETIKATGAEIRSGGDVACYVPSQDFIRMPARKQFPKIEDYYATAFHELTHWTAHESRLNRKLSAEQSEYAYEELIAEMGAAFLSAEHGIDAIVRHTNYLGYWIKHLKSDDQAIFRAAAAAQKAAKFIYNDEPEEVEEA